jgi:virginiamycin A acetyltransferase
MFDGDKDSVYLSNVVTDPDIQVGEHTYYNDFLKDSRDFQKNNVL